nr:hypothetical protein Itr_chr08CG13390 [Ipomoea trifida]
MRSRSSVAAFYGCVLGSVFFVSSLLPSKRLAPCGRECPKFGTGSDHDLVALCLAALYDCAPVLDCHLVGETSVAVEPREQ